MIDDDDGIGVPNCPTDLVQMVAEGHDEDGRDARWRCPLCGLTRIA